MALSYYSNWGPFQHSDIAIDDLLNPDDYLCNSLLSDLFATATQPAPFCFPYQQEEELVPSLHFQKLCQQLYPDPCLATLQDYSPLPDFPAADFSAKKEASGSGSLSAQSIAARQRRRRITVKTQELGKLVPGGQRMNTAEMLQSAYKYIKFLQAQVALLEFIGSCHQDVTQAPFEGEEEFQNLLESPLIQEKLYSTEHRLLPQKLVEQLRCDDQILKSNPHLLEKDH